MAKVLILTGDAGESLEVMYPYQRLLEEGYEVDIAAPSKKKLQFVVHDFVDGFDTYTEKLGYTWDADLAFADVDPSRLRRARRARRPRARVHPQRRRLSSASSSTSSPTRSPSPQLCHAPLVLGAAGVLEGRRTAAYPALEPDVDAAGATFEDGAGVVDGEMVSARAWPDHPAWMREFMRMLREHAPVERVEEAVHA